MKLSGTSSFSACPPNTIHVPCGKSALSHQRTFLGCLSVLSEWQSIHDGQVYGLDTLSSTESNHKSSKNNLVPLPGR